jgi:8-oxo-dGTP pyrophosphatase MutT (NUDIX family)
MKDLPEILKHKLIQSKFETMPNDGKFSMAAILIPLVMHNSEWHLVFTRRTNFVSTHQNEVSFPGGSFEPSDINLENTALRETKEEIGISNEKIEILGALQPLTTITNFSVFPFVAIMAWPTIMKINNCEVDSVFTIPLKWLMDDGNHYEEDYHNEKYGIRRVIHYKDFQGEHLWGFTAKVVRELLNIIK